MDSVIRQVASFTALIMFIKLFAAAHHIMALFLVAELAEREKLFFLLTELFVNVIKIQLADFNKTN